jgi:integrase/recombinase XerD
MKIHIYPLSIEATKRIAVVNKQFDTDFPDKMKQITGSRWTPDHQCWHIPYTKETWQLFEQLFEGHTIIREIKETERETDTDATVEEVFNLPDDLATKVSGSFEMTRLLPTSKASIKIEKVTFDNQSFIGVHIHFSDMENREKIKTIEGRSWHKFAKLWLVPYTAATYKRLQETFKDSLEIIEAANERTISAPMPEPKLTLKPEFEKSKHAFKEIDNTAIFYKLSKEQQKAITELENLLIEERKAYKTRQGYRNIFIQFLFQHPNTLPDNISNAQMKAFIVRRIKEEDVSKSTQNQIISTLKAYYGRFLEHPDRVANLYRPDKEEHLPKMMTPDEIARMLKQVHNLKHKCMLMLLYGSGLRVGELVRLQLKDLDFEEKTVFVDTGKHYKDRYTIFSEKSMGYLKKYLAEHTPKPQSWVFESPDGGHYSERSVQQIFTEARDKAHIKKQLNTHSFRHAFATELLKASSDLDFVRKVMGHASIKTTQVYLHVIRKDLTKTKSPLDDLDI